MRILGVFLLAGGLGSAAVAEPAGAINGRMLICSLTPDCTDCARDPIGVDIAMPDTLPGPASLLPDTGPADGTASDRDGTLVVGAQDAGAAYLLTRDADGSAVLSVQTSAPVSVATYQGTCRVVE